MNQDELWLLQEKYHGEKSEGFFTDCRHLESGEPLAYIIGSIPFLNTTIHLDSHPLIPRPETEFWVEKAISRIKQTQNENKYKNRGATPISEIRVLDLCAGSGAIGVAAAKAVPEMHVTFAEIDPTHFATIEKNLRENTIIYDSKKYLILESDLFEQVTERFDFILTNPPYIDEEANTVDQSVAEFEPHKALFGGEKGLVFIVDIIKNAHGYLTKDGELWIEHEPTQVDAIKTLATDSGFVCAVHNDQYGVPRYSILSMSQ
jgi:release factor glutamine methyltransferase